MKRGATIFLQIMVIVLGVGAAALLLWEPWLEGVNVHATSISQIYFDDPFLVLVYAGSAPFFIALYQAFNTLGYVRHNKIFSGDAVKALRMIQYCALVIIGFIAVEEIFIMLTHGSDDAAGGIMLGLLIALGSTVVAAAVSVFEGILQAGADLQSKND